MTTTKDDRTAELAKLGFALESSPPSWGVDENDKEGWPHIAYQVRLMLNGKEVLATDYRLGVGHVDIQKAHPDRFAEAWTSDEQSVLRTWQRNQSANFKDKALQAQVAAKLAWRQKVSPTLPDVLYSLLADVEPHFNHESFEEWAGNFGYDQDSRKAEKIFQQCVETGRKLARNVPAETLAKAREILQDY